MDEFLTETPKTRGSSDINLLNMIESRIIEIIQIEDECKRKLPKLYHQRLPRFMRRRAASHNPKRIPKKRISSEPGKAKSRKKLIKYRNRLRFRKRKRVSNKHARHKFKDVNKCLLHKWFAKRFKFGKKEPLLYVPLFNNTKNQRNLRRQSKFGCAYLSLAHLVPIQLSLASFKCVSDLYAQLEHLNQLSDQLSGFTFCARALEGGHYELAVHLYKVNSSPREYICPALVNLLKPAVKSDQPVRLTLWVPRDKAGEVTNDLQTISDNCDNKFGIKRLKPRDFTRIRLVGPRAQEETEKIVVNKKKCELAIQDAAMKLDRFYGLSIGRHLKEDLVELTYFNTKPLCVDIVFKTEKGRMLWYKLIKNKAHLVGGHRDIDRLLLDEEFKLLPDYEKFNASLATASQAKVPLEHPCLVAHAVTLPPTGESATCSSLDV